jgi:uncharacterized protein involved in response to NO
MPAIPRYRLQKSPALLSAGFRPFFLFAALWACLAIPMWLAALAGGGLILSGWPPVVWHAHEMVFGFGAAAVAGFLLTAIPNWTGRMPLQGNRLALLVLLWIAGRLANLSSAWMGATITAALDLAFPSVFFAAIAREIIGGRNWRNLPMLAALTLLLAGNLLVHFELLGVSETADVGNRLGIATLLMLISLIGGRIIPSFTRNWLARQRHGARLPAPFGVIDRIALGLTVGALALWTVLPAAAMTHWIEACAGLALFARLARWRGLATLREPLLWVLHLGYGWLAAGFLLLAINSFVPVLPQSTALHALTAGAIGTMTLAVMTRASLGHTGRPLTAGLGTAAIYLLVTLPRSCVFLPRLLAGITYSCSRLAVQHGAQHSASSCCSTHVSSCCHASLVLPRGRSKSTDWRILLGALGWADGHRSPR